MEVWCVQHCLWGMGKVPEQNVYVLLGHHPRFIIITNTTTGFAVVRAESPSSKLGPRIPRGEPLAPRRQGVALPKPEKALS